MTTKVSVNFMFSDLSTNREISETVKNEIQTLQFFALLFLLNLRLGLLLPSYMSCFMLSKRSNSDLGIPY